MNTFCDLFAAIHALSAENWPGRVPVRVEIHLHDAQQPICLPVPAAIGASRMDVAFVPNAFQQAILEALEAKAMRTEALAAKVGDRSRLFAKPRGGIAELREHGLVGHHSRLGFYSVNAPPPELTEGAGA